MNRKPLAELIPVLAKGIGSTTAVATGLLAPMALGASGDLDPEFADGGRLGPIPELNGAAWSVEALDGDGVLIGGGDSDEYLLLLVRMRPRIFELRERTHRGRRIGRSIRRAGDQRY